MRRLRARKVTLGTFAVHLVVDATVGETGIVRRRCATFPSLTRVVVRRSRLTIWLTTASRS